MNRAKQWKMKVGGKEGKKKWRKIVEKRREESKVNEGSETEAGLKKLTKLKLKKKMDKVKKKGNKCEVGKTKENRRKKNKEKEGYKEWLWHTLTVITPGVSRFPQTLGECPSRSAGCSCYSRLQVIPGGKCSSLFPSLASIMSEVHHPEAVWRAEERPWHSHTLSPTIL